jgi:phosphoribosylformylglycinamidine cyclo-ligase
MTASASPSASASAYHEAGVDYDTLDAAKRRALAAAMTTSAFARGRGAVVADRSRGEPAVVFSLGGVTLAFVLECLGTKSMIARAFEEACGVDRFASIGYDTVAAAVNDLVCVGALPVMVNAYFATGDASWYAGHRHDSLVAGFARACEQAGAAWGGGESPTLSGLVSPEEIDLAASSIGTVPPGTSAPWLGEHLSPGDEIVLVSSSGMHTNGASLARAVAARLADGWAHRLPGGRSLGDAVLDESAIYVDLVERLLAERVAVTYVSHITGHGLRKLMRPERELTYRLHLLPEVPEVLSFLAGAGSMSARDAYGTFNMGAGLAVYCRRGSGVSVVDAAGATGHPAIVAGVVEEGERKVVLEPVGVEFAAHELNLR